MCDNICLCTDTRSWSWAFLNCGVSTLFTYLLTYVQFVCRMHVCGHACYRACVRAPMLQGMCVGTHVAVHVYRAEDNFVEFISLSIFTWLQESSSGCQLCAAKVFYYLYFSWGSLLSMKLWLAWSLLCKSGWHWTHKKSYLWPPCAGIKSVCPPYVAWPYFLKTGFPIKSWRLLLD